MSVLGGLGISNVDIEIDANELPALDGSGVEYLQAFHKVGCVDQDADVAVFHVREPLGVERNGASIYIVPAQDFRVSYTLDYDHPMLKSQFVQFNIDQAIYEKEIASCRTFCLEKEVASIKDKGLGKGATPKNALVFGEKGVIDNSLRFADECARHKVLDFIGDLYLLGVPIRGHPTSGRRGPATARRGRAREPSTSRPRAEPVRPGRPKSPAGAHRAETPSR